MKEILLKTKNLSKSFSSSGALQHVLKNIDLQLYKGDFTVIMGASGAGSPLFYMRFQEWIRPLLVRLHLEMRLYLI